MEWRPALIFTIQENSRWKLCHIYEPNTKQYSAYQLYQSGKEEWFKLSDGRIVASNNIWSEYLPESPVGMSLATLIPLSEREPIKITGIHIEKYFFKVEQCQCNPITRKYCESSISICTGCKLQILPLEIMKLRYYRAQLDGAIYKFYLLDNQIMMTDLNGIIIPFRDSRAGRSWKLPHRVIKDINLLLAMSKSTDVQLDHMKSVAKDINKPFREYLQQLQQELEINFY